MPKDARAKKFIQQLVDKVQARHNLTTDQEIINLLPKKKTKKGQRPLFHLQTLRKWKAGLQFPELQKLDALIKLADPKWTVADCLHIPSEDGFERAIEVLRRESPGGLAERRDSG